ncbi:MAG: phosphoglucomutase/phosphomannomutase family protein [Candidatus Omnitrophica bacterium]|nr:phosphoglucomutase/phosphomannomutase family protein [Candidatus Omnitrophota bacterium]
MGKIKFGTDGWRAIIDEDFTFENVKVVAQAIADYVNSVKDKEELRGKELIVGYDTRRNSEEYSETVTNVLTANGIKVILTDRVTSTPAVSFAIKIRNLTGGVMITASHNPPNYSGIKYKAFYSGSADPGIIDKIEENLFKSKIKEISLEEAKKKGLLKIDNVITDQLEYVMNYVDMELIRNSGFKVIVDSMYGGGGHYIEDMMKGTSCKVTTIHGERDITFGGISPEPIGKNLKELIRESKEGSYDIGLATDGDVDRIGATASDGMVLNGQHIMALLLWHFVEDRKMTGSVITTVCGTGILKRICEKYGLKLHETPVGFKYICDIMRREDVLIGGEEAGGIGFKNYIPERDGILSGLLLLEMMACRKKPIKKILDDMEKEFGSYHYLKTSIKLTEATKKKFMPYIEKNPPSAVLGKKVIETSTKDGIKFSCEDSSWLIFRLSGTEPILRIYSEAHTEDDARKILEFGRDLATSIK